MATSIGSGALKIKQALLIAAVFEFAGAVLAGGEVTSTIRKGMVDSSLFADSPEVLIFGMLATLLAAGTWLYLASKNGWPVSTTHSIVGAVVGFAIVAVGFDAVKWSKVGTIAASWIISPLTAGIIAYFIFTSIKALILVRRNPLERAKRFAPFYVFIAVMLIALVTMFKGLKHVGLNLEAWQCYVIAVIVAALVAGIGKIAINRIPVDQKANRRFHYHTVERVFAVLMVITACGMAFAHGSNDVANAIGPVAAIVSIAQAGTVGQEAQLPIWVLFLGGVGIVFGLATYGRRVIMTVGTQITQLTPSRGFSINLAAAFTIVVASGTGLPISTTHTLIGAVLGVGMAKGISAINLNIVGQIFLSWVITIPAGAILSVTFFFIIRALLG
jgi:PiT family inorganic phosphate transporter